MNKRRRNRAKDTTAATKVVAWRISDWCKAISISRAQFYVLRDRGGIEVIKLGGTMPLITTAPEQYLAWVQAQAAAATPSPAEAPPDPALLGDPAPAVKRPRGRRVAQREPAPPAAPLAAAPRGD